MCNKPVPNLVWEKPHERRLQRSLFTCCSAWTKPDVVAVAAAAHVARVGRSVGLAAILLKEHRMSNHPNSISGLTDEEAQEFHHYWIQGTVGFTAVAVLAHILVWAWRPWFV